jgi:hypothetical protein
MRSLLVAVALLVAACDGRGLVDEEGTATCYQMGTLIWSGKIRYHGIFILDENGNDLVLPRDCIYTTRRAR